MAALPLIARHDNVSAFITFIMDKLNKPNKLNELNKLKNSTSPYFPPTHRFTHLPFNRMHA